LESRSHQLEQLLAQGTQRLLARAAESRALKPEVLTPRIASAVAQLFRYQKLHENFRRAELDSALAVKTRLDQLIGTNR